MPSKKEPNTNTNDSKKESNPPINTDFGSNQYVMNMWTNYQNEYIAQLNDICYNQEFPVHFNDAEVKDVEDLLHIEAVWVSGKLLRKRLTEYQTEYLENLKSKMFDAIRKAGLSLEDYKEKNIPLPEDYTVLNEKRRRAETEYYEEALKIMFKLKLDKDGSDERQIVHEDKYRLERDPCKFAIDAVHLSFGKRLPKNPKTLQNLYT